MIKKLILPGWILVAVLLFLYSYTQVDLSLTLSKASFLQTIEKQFQYIGYFNRPLSTYLYIAIFVILFFLYFATLKLVLKNKISERIIWKIIIVTTIILTFSYSAFSYDIFNYIFDARIITFYHQNPYLHKALDFPSDPMLSFMHWTHRTYPYGPIWLMLTVPLTFIANEFFILTFFIFKILSSVFFLMTVYFVSKIAKQLKLKNSLLPITAFAFNPFVLSESLVSAHNDIAMMGLAMAGVYYLFERKIIVSGLSLILSIGIKFVTGLLLVPAVVFLISKRHLQFIYISIIVMVLGVLVATIRTNFQPWYLLYIAPFASLLFEKKIILISTIVLSIAAVIYYIPFLYTGNWDYPIPSILNSLMVGAVFLSILFTVLLAKRK